MQQAIRGGAANPDVSGFPGALSRSPLGHSARREESPPQGLLAFIGVEPLRGIGQPCGEIAETLQLAQGPSTMPSTFPHCSTCRWSALRISWLSCPSPACCWLT